MNMRVLLACLGASAALLFACASGPNDKTPPTRPVNATPASTPYVAGTVISSFGKLEPFDSFESAELRLGWRIMRPRDPRFHLVQQGGLLRTDADVGLPRVEQAYAMDGRKGLIEIYQEPEAYPLRWPPDSLKPLTLGRIEGQLHKTLPHGTFFFFSGERIADQRIRIGVYTNQPSEFTEDDFMAFVESLDIGVAAGGR